MPFHAFAMTARTWLGNDFALPATPGAGNDIGEAPEDTLLDLPDLASTLTVGTNGWLSARFAAQSTAFGAALGAGYNYLLLHPKGGFLQGNGYAMMKVNTLPWPLSSSGRPTAEEGIKYIAETAEVKAFKALVEEPFSTMSEAVIGSTLVRIGEHFVSFVDLLKPVFSPVIPVMIRMIFKGQLAKCTPYPIRTGIPVHTQDIVIIALYRHISN
jgi:hypothetical protein